jgi:hypothetical protein
MLVALLPGSTLLAGPRALAIESVLDPDASPVVMRHAVARANGSPVAAGDESEFAAAGEDLSGRSPLAGEERAERRKARAAATGSAGTLTLSASAFITALPSGVLLTATIAGAKLTGIIVFMNGPATLGTAVISGSKAVLGTNLPAGIHRVRATYSGGGKVLDSNVLDLVIDNALVCN